VPLDWAAVETAQKRWNSYEIAVFEEAYVVRNCILTVAPIRLGNLMNIPDGRRINGRRSRRAVNDTVSPGWKLSSMI